MHGTRGNINEKHLEVKPLGGKRQMDKETLLTEFGTRLGNTDSEGNYTQSGISARTLNTYVEQILPTVGEEVNDDFYTTHVAILNTMGGQMRKQIADAIKAAQAKQQPKPEQPTEIETPSESEDKELKELTATVKSLTERLNAQEKAHKTAENLAQLKTLLKEQGATDEYVLRNTLRGYTLPEGKEPKDVVEDVLKAYDNEMRECRGDGATPRTGNGGSTSQTAVSNYFARKKAREKWGN